MKIRVWHQATSSISLHVSVLFVCCCYLSLLSVQALSLYLVIISWIGNWLTRPWDPPVTELGHLLSYVSAGDPHSASCSHSKHFTHWAISPGAFGPFCKCILKISQFNRCKMASCFKTAWLLVDLITFFIKSYILGRGEIFAAFSIFSF